MSSLESFPAFQLPQTRAQPILQLKLFFASPGWVNIPANPVRIFESSWPAMAAAWQVQKWLTRWNDMNRGKPYHQPGMACVSSNGTERCGTWYIKGTCFLCPKGCYQLQLTSADKECPLFFVVWRIVMSNLRSPGKKMFKACSLMMFYVVCITSLDSTCESPMTPIPSIPPWSHNGLTVPRPRQRPRQWSGTALMSSCHSWMDCRIS